ncbi:4'-phosphopantetheinyl transferase [uncultured Vagococcus sp.]|uniref:4'-phosphopantetheinyl transferase n=1 Tax=uncultured Vagococcus sp. TaxID=189676 RepID=UPI0028D5524E|nr:4'-phosphopantetheinyl transferase [uncultured Vagococcus sp.]
MLKLAQELLLKQYQIESSEEDWAYESVTMEKEELDPESLPKDSQLPDLVMTHVYLLDAGRTKVDYTVYFITNPTSEVEYVRGVLLDGEIAWYQTGGHHE